MPWESKRQSRWGHGKGGKKAGFSKEKIEEYDDETDWENLPEEAKVQGSKLVTLFRIADHLDRDDVGKHALAAQIYEVISKQTTLSPEGKKLLRDYFGFGRMERGQAETEVGDFGENVPEADYQTRRDPFRDNPTERGPEPKSDMLAQVKQAAAALESHGEFVLARSLRSEFGA